MTGICLDITDRKIAEEQLRETKEYLDNLLDYANAPIIVWDRTFKIVRFNHAFERLTGFLSKDLIGKDLEILFPKESKKDTLQKIQRTLSGEYWETVEIPILCKDNNIRIALWNSANIYDKTGKDFRATIAQGVDITERKNSEDKIKKLNENLMRRSIELAIANKELETFSYSVSHDLRAPLRSIDGFSQALLEDYAGKFDEQGKEYLQRVRNATKRMEQLIDDLLRLSRLTRAEMNIETVDLGKIADNIIEELKKTDPSRNYKFKTQKNMYAKGDANLLNILLENLLGNAWKFTKKRKLAEIEFGMKQQEKETVFFIRDNGAGFNMKYADKLFVPFQRLHDDAEYPGTGIGLGIVGRIIHRHGGRIWVEAEEDKGATFFFTLGGKTNE
jgi:PAS domain S-box-containing protein